MLPKLLITLMFTMPCIYWVYYMYEKAAASNTVYPFLFFFSPIIILGVVVWWVAMTTIWTSKH